jgi:hypothetical protein
LQNKLSQRAGLGSLKTKKVLSGNAVESIISKQVRNFETKKKEEKEQGEKERMS